MCDFGVYWLGQLGRQKGEIIEMIQSMQRCFVERYLDRCAAADGEALNWAIDALAAAAMSGMKSGTRGKPMPRVLKARDDAQAVLTTMPRLSPAYPLYEAILKDAERDIAQAIHEGKALDAEDEE